MSKQIKDLSKMKAKGSKFHSMHIVFKNALVTADLFYTAQHSDTFYIHVSKHSEPLTHTCASRYNGHP